MIVDIDNSFEKDLSKIRDNRLSTKILDKLEEFKFVENIYDVSNIKAMKGFHNLYRIRVGDYRVGFKLRGNTIIVLRVCHRKDIYKVFP